MKANRKTIYRFNKIEKSGFTEYFAKKRALRAAIEFFQRETNVYFVELKASWNDEVNKIKGEELIIARREVISQFLGFDFVKARISIEKIDVKTRDEIIELWKLLKQNESENN